MQKNQTISARLTDRKHEKKKKVETVREKREIIKTLKEYMLYHTHKYMIDKTYHHMGRDKFQNINYLQER